jgi:hypothetical protein
MGLSKPVDQNPLERYGKKVSRNGLLMIEIKKEAMMGEGEVKYYTLETTRSWRLGRPKWVTRSPRSLCSAAR